MGRGHWAQPGRNADRRLMAGLWETTKAGGPHLHAKMKKTGGGLVWIGAILLVTSIFDLAILAVNGGAPNLFWIGIFALPMIFAGIFLKRFASVVKVVGGLDANASQEDFLDAARALGQQHPGVKLVTAVAGVPGELQTTAENAHVVQCSTCDNQNDDAARFCDGCGAVLIAGLACPSCDELNDSTARTCIACDERL